MRRVLIIVIITSILAAALPRPALADAPRQLATPGKCGQFFIDEYNAVQTDDAEYTLNFALADKDGYPFGPQYGVSGWSPSEWSAAFTTGDIGGYGDGWLRHGLGDNTSRGAAWRFEFGYDDCMVESISVNTTMDGLATFIGIAVKNDPDDDTSYFYDQAVDSWDTGFGHAYESHGWDYTGTPENLYSVWLATLGTGWYYGAFDRIIVTFDGDDPLPPDEETPAQYIRPLMPEDEQAIYPEWGGLLSGLEDHVIDSNTYMPYSDDGDGDNAPLDAMNEYTLMYRSLAPGAFVHSPGYGVVESITDVSITDCNDGATLNTPAGTAEEILLAAVGLEWLDLYQLLTGGGNHNYCYVSDPDDWSSGDMNVVYRYSEANDPHAYILPFDSYDNALLAAGQIVQIYMASTEQYLSYWVMDAHEYVVEGQSVNDGCVIGLTLPALMTADALVDDAVTLDLGVGFIWGEALSGATYFPQDIHLMFWSIPRHNDPCGDPDYTGCINGNSEFIPPLWPWSIPAIDEGNHVLPSGGLLLRGDSSTDAIQTITLPDPADDYAIKVVARMYEPNDTDTDLDIVVYIGDDDYNIAVPADGSEIEYLSVLDTRADSDYTNTSIIDIELQYDEADDSGVVLVTFVCVDNEADAVAPPPDCILLDYSFDETDTSNWTITDNIPTGDALIEDGALELGIADTANQTIDLWATTYTVNIKFRALPMLVPPIGGYSTRVDWWYEDSGTSVLASGQYTNNNAGGDWQDWQELSFRLTSPYSDGNFYLDASNATDAPQIDYVCLIPLNVPWVGDSLCQSCPVEYVGDAIADNIEAIEWHSCRIRQLYYCDWRDFVERTTDATEQTVRGIGMFGRWQSEVTQRTATFFTNAFRYLGGHLNNVGLAITDSIAWQRGGSTTIVEDTPLGFWDVLGLLITGLQDVINNGLASLVEAIGMMLSFLTPIAGALLGIVELVVAGLFGLLQQLIGTVELIYYFIAAIIEAMNSADPVTVAGAPDCSVLTPGEWYCYGFYILDNTIFNGPAAAMLPILIGAAALNLLLWGFDRVKVALVNAG